MDKSGVSYPRYCESNQYISLVSGVLCENSLQETVAPGFYARLYSLRNMETIYSLHLVGVGMALTGSVLLFASGETVPALTALTLAAITGFSFTQWSRNKERIST